MPKVFSGPVLITTQMGGTRTVAIAIEDEATY